MKFWNEGHCCLISTISLWVKNDLTWANNLHLFCPFRTAIHDPTQKIRQREWFEGEISQSSAWAATITVKGTHTRKVDQRKLVIANVCTVGKLAFCQINAECKYTAAVKHKCEISHSMVMQVEKCKIVSTVFFLQNIFTLWGGINNSFLGTQGSGTCCKNIIIW